MFKSILRFRFFMAMVLLIVLLGIGSSSQVRVFAASVPISEPPLRSSEPLVDIVADLEEFIPGYMEQQGVPGVVIALIREGRVVWTEGFGVTNVLTRKPVTPDSTFKVASNSKVVTAYIALRLVDQGMISLDEPLDSYLSEPFMPQEAYRPVVTLRHTLSHTSGMGSTGISRKVRFPPGAGYSYSPSGYAYTQKVVEAVTGKSLEELGQELVFQPLSMENSSFVKTPTVMEKPARGHLPALLPALIFEIPFLVVLLVLAIIASIVGRIRSGHGRISRRTALTIYVLAALPVCVLIFLLYMGLSTTYTLLMLIIWGAPLLAFLVGDTLLKRWFPERPKLRKGVLVVLMLVVALAMSGGAIALGDLPGVLPEAAKPDAAASIRATAADMARFLIEIADPQHLSSEIAKQMHIPQVSLRSDLSWGLGPGIQHSPEGDALWQWGQELDFQSVMIIYPDLGYGAVVLTNSDALNAGVAIEIAHRALGGRMDAIRRAALSQEFNYQGPLLEE